MAFLEHEGHKHVPIAVGNRLDGGPYRLAEPDEA